MNKLLLIAIIFININFANAQSLEILARVNDDIITAYDLNSKILMAMNSVGVKNTKENRQKFTTKILHLLIDEKLKLQEAERENIKISEDEIAKVVSSIESKNNMKAGELFAKIKQFGISDDYLLNQIKADIAWMKIIRKNGKNEIAVSDSEIDEAIVFLKNNAHKNKYFIKEIFIPFNDKMSKKEVYDSIVMMAKDIRKNGKFEIFARQFSASPTAIRYGNLGWIFEGQLDKELDQIVVQMKEGEISNPIITKDGLYILQMDKKEKIEGNILPDREKIKARLMNKKAEIFADKYLRDIRKTAMIEVKK